MNGLSAKTWLAILVATIFTIAFANEAKSAETRIFGIGLKTTVGSGVSATETRTIGSFDRVEIRDGITATIRQGGAPALTLSADDNILPLVDTRIQGSTLIVSMKRGSNTRTKTPIKAALTFTELKGLLIADAARAESDALSGQSVKVKVADAGNLDLKGIIATEAEVVAADAANVRIGDVSKAERLRYRVSDASNLTLNTSHGNRTQIIVSDSGKIVAKAVKADQIDVAVSDASRADITGVAAEQSYKVSDSSTVNARDLSGASAVAKVSDASSLTLGALQSIDVKASDGSSVRYSGDPKITGKAHDGASIRRI